VAFVVKSKNDGHEHSVAEKILLRSNMSIRIKYHKRMKEIKAEEKAMARAAKRKSALTGKSVLQNPVRHYAVLCADVHHDGNSETLANSRLQENIQL